MVIPLIKLSGGAAIGVTNRFILREIKGEQDFIIGYIAIISCFYVDHAGPGNLAA